MPAVAHYQRLAGTPPANKAPERARVMSASRRVRLEGRCLMPRTAVAASSRHDDDVTMTHVDELIQRGRGQGQLSLPELRAAFERASISPTEARAIIRELTEAGVQLGNEPSEGAADAADAAAAELAAAELAAAEEAGLAVAGKPAVAASPAAAAAAPLAARAAELLIDLPSEADLDDQTSVMGDSVHTYLKSIGRTSLLTAEDEVNLAKRIEAGLYAEHKLETEAAL